MPLAISQPRGFEAAQKSKIQLEAVYTLIGTSSGGVGAGTGQAVTGTRIPCLCPYREARAQAQALDFEIVSV